MKLVKKNLLKFIGDKYEYPEETSKAHCKFNVRCKIHGLFLITPTDHQQGKGCPKCGRDRTTNSNTYIHNQHVEIFNKVHEKEHYSYPNNIISDSKKFDIYCNKCNAFFLCTPNNHKQGKGCPTCFRNNLQGGWTNTDWIAVSNKSKYFDSFKIYIIKCIGNGEEFIKIGKTFKTVKNRFPSKSSLPYEYQILNEIVFKDALACTNFERRVKS